MMMPSAMPCLSIRQAPPLLLCLALLTAGGCQWGPDALPEDWKLSATETEPQVPDRMMAVWSDTILHEPQKPGVRGFGGRLYFYRGPQPAPVEVDGGLVVYAFDSGSPRSSSTKPEKKFVFTADQFAEHMSHTEMGPSYSVWLPWDEIGGANRKLTLIARFEGRQGGVVLSKPSSKLLPGVTPLPAAEDAGGEAPAEGILQAVGEEGYSLRGDRGVRQASQWELPSKAAQPKARDAPARRSPFTIDLPSNFRRHLVGPSRRKSESSAQPTPAAKTPAEAGETEPAGAAPGPASDTAPPADENPGEPEQDRDARASAPSRSRFPSRWQRHPFRQLATPEALANKPSESLRRPAGWLEPLPRTPRALPAAENR